MAYRDARVAMLLDPRRVTARRSAVITGVSLVAMACASPALAQSDNSQSGGIDVIVVTAQKYEEAVNTVPMSITAATGEELNNLGIDEPRDLGKITPSFHYADSYVGSPIFTLRGVGFSDISLGGRSTVAVYQDQAPIPFAIETRGASLDLSRVEVLKGPQGTLFGQNATGGAINYIAARPTDSFEAGVDLSVGNFSAVDAEGYLSGPLGENAGVRLAVAHKGADDWQESYTTGAGNGAVDFTNARLLVDWDPAETLALQFSINGWVDRSDTQAGQLIAVTPLIPPLAGFVPGLLTYPLAPADAKAADFTPGKDYSRDNKFFQATVRADLDLNDDLVLTSLTSYSSFSQEQLQDIDGTTLLNLSQLTLGDIDSVSEELRLAQTFTGGRVIVGASYANDSVSEVGFLENSESTLALAFTPRWDTFRDESNQEIETWAAFASGEYNLTDTLTASAGVRYTTMTNAFDGCTSDSGDGNAAAVFGGVLGATIPAGGCITADSTFTPGRVFDTLEEDNVSWRVGLDWTPFDRTMFYANVSRGFKAGSFPILGATLASQLEPATQEAITSYEGGFKTTLLDGAMQLNGALFHSDYDDKQILGKVVDPFLGPLLRLVNVPKSQIDGAELQVVWAPIDGLTLTSGASYIRSEILDHFTNFDPGGALKDFDGESFPNTPELQFVAAADYVSQLTEGINLILGANVSYEGDTNSQLGELDRLSVDSYTLLDLRAGIEAQDGSWRLTAWGRNVTDEYYWTTGNANLDTTVRFVGMPATYGLKLSLKW
ncbi:MAG: TonB-dependent receptor [Hyphomonadaceae bacterium]